MGTPSYDPAADVVELCRDLIRIDTTNFGDQPGPGERKAAEHVATLLDEVGIESELWEAEPGRTNVLARWGGSTGDPVLVHGHLDVVPADADDWQLHPFSGEIRDGRLMGRGSCDMKAGLVAAYWAVQAIRRSGVGLRGDLLLASVQGEEDGGLGTFATLERGWRADACVIPEPTSLDIIPANSGALTFRLRVHGLATHAARRTEGVSAVEKFWPVWRALTELERRRHADVDPLATRWAFAHPISIGAVRAGDWA